MSLRIEDIKDVDIAKQVAQLALAENDRLHKRLEAIVKEMAVLKGESGAEQLEIELLHLKEQMSALQHRMFAASSEKRSRNEKAEAGVGSFQIESVHSGKCLDVAAASQENGGNVQQWHCDDVINQEWGVTKEDGTVFVLE